MDIIFNKLQNKLHLESCPNSGHNSIIYFSNIKNIDDFYFLYLLVFYFVNIESNPNIEICSHCLGDKYDLILKYTTLQ